jgi:hypothetical protein
MELPSAAEIAAFFKRADELWQAIRADYELEEQAELDLQVLSSKARVLLARRRECARLYPTQERLSARLRLGRSTSTSTSAGVGESIFTKSFFRHHTSSYSIDSTRIAYQTHCFNIVNVS